MMAQKTYMERLAENMKQFAGKIALRDGQHPDGITYGEVADRSGRVYAWLKQRGIGREKMVLVKLPRGTERETRSTADGLPSCVPGKA